jgi:hypothetical protein
MERETIPYWVQRCETCGYCAADISAGTTSAQAVVASREYQDLLNSDLLPELAANFLCAARLEEAAGRQADAGWEALHAAWASDDAESHVSAHQCRSEALRLFEAARLTGEPIAEDGATERAIIPDLLRRTQQFHEAAEHCRDSLPFATDHVLNQVLRFEIALADMNDASCHTIDEAEQFGTQNPE